MHARRAVIAGILSIIATGTAPGASASAIDHIVTALEQDRVDRVEIVRIPREVASRTAFTPEMLEGGYYYKLLIRHVRAPKLRDAMIRSLKGLAVEPSPERADLRWGMLVFLKGDVRVGSIYMDEDRRNGTVDGRPVRFRGDALAWLKPFLGDGFY